MRRNAVTISNGEITTPQMQLNMDGFLGAADSALEVKFRAEDLGQWDDFIAAIRGPDAAPRPITGKVSWNGRILGPLVGPVFIGQMHATEARYDTLYWDDIAGEMEYSPDDFHLTKTTVRRGATSADIDLALEFDKDWDFAPESTWSLTGRMRARAQRRSAGDLQHALPVQRFPDRQRPWRRHPRAPRTRFRFHVRRYRSRQVPVRQAHRPAARGIERDSSLSRGTAQGSRERCR